MRGGEITHEQFRNYKISIFRPRQEKVSRLINAIRENNDMFSYGDRASETPTNPKYAELLTLKTEGTTTTQYDTDIDLDNL